MLFLDLDAPISELAHWKSGHRLRVEARWKPKYFFSASSVVDQILGIPVLLKVHSLHTYTLENRL